MRGKKGKNMHTVNSLFCIIYYNQGHVNIYVYKYIILPMQHCANSFQTVTVTVTVTSLQQWAFFSFRKL